MKEQPISVYEGSEFENGKDPREMQYREAREMEWDLPEQKRKQLGGKTFPSYAKTETEQYSVSYKVNHPFQRRIRPRKGAKLKKISKVKILSTSIDQMQVIHNHLGIILIQANIAPKKGA